MFQWFKRLMRLLRSFRLPRLGKILTGHGRQDSTASASAVVTGLQTVGIYPNSAVIGSQIDVEIDGGAPTGNIRFGSTPNGTEYGDIAPGALPFTVPGGDDTGDALNPAPIYISSVTPGEEFSLSYAIRPELPTIVADAAISLSTDLGAPGPDVDDIITQTPAVFGNVPAVFNRIMTKRREGAVFQTNDGSVDLANTIVPADDNALFDGDDVLSGSFGTLTSDALGSVQVKDFEEPSNTAAPAVSGDAGLGGTLTVTNGAWDANPGITSYLYQWYRGAAAIAGATSNSYVVTQADSSSSITCQVRAVNDIGTSTPAASNAVIIAEFSAPQVTAPPAITESRIGAAPVFTPAVVDDGNVPTTTAYRLFVDGTDVGDETTVLLEAWNGLDIFLRATATNAIDSDVADSVTGTVIYNAPTETSPFSPVTLTQGVAMSPIDLKDAVTVVGDADKSGVAAALQSGTLPPGLFVSGAGIMSGTPTELDTDTLTFRMSTSGGFVDISIQITVEAAVTAPTLTSATFTDNNDGTPASLALERSGNDAGYSVQLETLDGGGGVIETTTIALGTDVDVTGFTGASNAAVNIRVTLVGGAAGPSNSITEAVSGLDFTRPTVQSAVTDAAGDTITLTMSETVIFSEDVADWVFSGVTGGAPTVVSVTGSGTNTITIEISGNLVVNGDSPQLAYTDTESDARDPDGNFLLDFTGLAVTNNVPGAGGLTLTPLGVPGEANATTAEVAKTIPLDTSLHDDVSPLVIEVALFGCAGQIISATLDGVPATFLDSQDNATTRPLVALAVFPGQAYADATNLVVTTDATALDGAAAMQTPSATIAGVTRRGDQPGTTSSDTANLDVTTSTAGNAIVAATSSQDGGANVSEVGVTEIVDFDFRSLDHLYVGVANDIPGGPRTITITQTGSNRLAGAAWELEAA